MRKISRGNLTCFSSLKVLTIQNYLHNAMLYASYQTQCLLIDISYTHKFHFSGLK